MLFSHQKIFLLLMLTLGLILVSQAKSLIKEPEQARYQEAVFAGGCFWCIESNMEKLPGVISAVSGYSDGDIKNPNYKQVASGQTKHYEVVKVKFDASKISYLDLLAEFWRIINPTDDGGSFVDRGHQYRSVIFYQNSMQQKLAEKTKQQLNTSGLFKETIVTEIKPLKNFYPAEEYHQDYYKNNPIRYKYYRYRSGRDDFTEKVWGENKISWNNLKQGPYKVTHNNNKTPVYDYKTFKKPSPVILKKTLSPLQFKVTQEEGTERPYQNEFWDNKKSGIYVDIVSGEPLFSSTDKYDSKTGWPSFTKPIQQSVVTEKNDFHLFMKRVEVKSKIADSHLGHVFTDGPKPTGLRYCINSASLNFIPVNKLQEMGYQEYLSLFSE